MPKVCGFWRMVVAALQWQAILNVYVLLVRDALTSIYAENSHASQTAGINVANLFTKPPQEYLQALQRWSFHLVVQ